MKQGTTHLSGLIAIVICCIIGSSVDAIAAAPSRIEVFGTVTDADQTPIPDASVTLIAACNMSNRLIQDLNPDRPHIETSTKSQGEFQIGFSADDQRFLAQGDSLLLVRATGFLAALISMPMERMKVDVAFDVVLQPAGPVAIEVSQSDGDPLPGASVYPASINNSRWRLNRCKTVGFWHLLS